MKAWGMLAQKTCWKSLRAFGRRLRIKTRHRIHEMGLTCALHIFKWNMHAHGLKVSPGTPLGTSPGSHGQLLAIPTVSTVFYTHRDPASTRSWPSVVSLRCPALAELAMSARAWFGRELAPCGVLSCTQGSTHEVPVHFRPRHVPVAASGQGQIRA